MANRVEVFDDRGPSRGSPDGVARDQGTQLRRLDLRSDLEALEWPLRVSYAS